MSSDENVSDKIDMSLDQIIDMEKKERRHHSRERNSSKFSPYERTRRRRSYSRSRSRSPRERRSENGRRVYVGNIAWETSWQDLKDHMKQVGEVEYANIFKEGNRSKGCGIVEFTTKESAKKAIDELNDTTIKGSDRLIFVREDRDREESRHEHGGSSRSFSKSNDRRSYDRRDNDRRDNYRNDRRDNYRDDRNTRNHRSDRRGRQLFVDNLPYNAKWYDLKDYFRTFGDVEKADVIQGRDGRSAGRGTVLFEKSSDMRYALKKAHESDFKGRTIYVKEDEFTG